MGRQTERRQQKTSAPQARNRRNHKEAQTNEGQSYYPKIPVTFVRENGLRVFLAKDEPVAVLPLEPEPKPRGPEKPE